MYHVLNVKYYSSNQSLLGKTDPLSEDWNKSWNPLQCVSYRRGTVLSRESCARSAVCNEQCSAVCQNSIEIRTVQYSFMGQSTISHRRGSHLLSPTLSLRPVLYSGSDVSRRLAHCLCRGLVQSSVQGPHCHICLFSTIKFYPHPRHWITHSNMIDLPGFSGVEHSTIHKTF